MAQKRPAATDAWPLPAKSARAAAAIGSHEPGWRVLELTDGGRHTATGRIRVCFQLSVGNDKVERFAKAYESVWPDYQESLHRHGLQNFSLFCHSDGSVIGYFESEAGFQEAWARVHKEDSHMRWREHVKAVAGGADIDAMCQLRRCAYVGANTDELKSASASEETATAFEVQCWTGGGGRTGAGRRRVCFSLELGEADIDQFCAYHARIRPELQEAMQRCGWWNFSLFCHGDGLAIGFFEAAESLDQCTAALSREPAGIRWQDDLKRHLAAEVHLGESLRELRPCAYLGRDRAIARIAVAGAGGWSQGWHLPMLHRNSDSKIAAIIEPVACPHGTLNADMRPTKELGETYGVPVFSSIDEFLASDAVSGTDGVIVSSNHATHAEIGIKAMKAGLHVLMEKPMTTDPKEALDLTKAAAACGRIFAVNNSANFREQASRIRELIRGGEIGELRHVSAYFGTALLWLFENPENAGWVKPSGTMLGNGFGWGQMSHVLAWVYFVTDLVPKTVFCQMVTSEATGADIFDTVTVRCANGATISAQGVAALPFGSHTGTAKQIDSKIFGSKGYLTYSGEDGAGSVEGAPETGGIVVRRHDGTGLTIPGFLFENYDSKGSGPESLRAFIGGCVGRPFANCADATVGFRAVQTIDAMYRSARSGRAEDVVADPATESG